MLDLVTRFLFASLLMVLLCSCSNDRRGVVDGSAGSDAGSDAGADTDAATAPSACPADPPVDGTACDQTLPCQYFRCADVGLVTAQCLGLTWAVGETPCDTFECFGETCGPDQLCLDMSGGAAIGQCVDNPCGTAPVGCGCLDTICATRGDDCMYFGSRTFRCSAGCDKCP